MLDIISANPYRVLGVYSNSPKKELVANLSKINAFLKVGKAVSFPTDMPSLLSEIGRTNEMVADANSKLALPGDQFRYAQFWFVKVTKFDDIALNNLIAGDVTKALSIWEKREDASSLQNRLVCNLVLDNVSEAISCAEKLYTSYKKDFVKEILGDNPTIDTENVEYDILDKLGDELGANEILPYVSNENWKKHISSQAVKPLVDVLMNAVSVAKQSKGNGPTGRYKAGTKLMNDTKKPLAELKKLTGKSDVQYQMVADKVGLEILQCGIDYFNGTKDADAPQKAMKLQSYAQSVVVGEMAKGRCADNVKILKEISREYAIRDEINRIKRNIDSLNGSSGVSPSLYSRYNTIDSIDRCVRDCETDLSTIKASLGAGDQLYIKISSAIVGSAVNAMVGVVNRDMASAYSNISGFRNEVDAAIRLMRYMSQWAMDDKTSEYYNKNRNSLSNLSLSLIPSSYGYGSSPRSSTYPPSGTSSGTSSGGGCYIATMVYGDYDSPQVMVLRGFRDNYLAKRGWGRTFIKYYYKYSPKLVEKLKGCKSINSFIRSILDHFIRVLKRRERPMS